MNEFEEEVGELRLRLDALSKRVRLLGVARRFIEGSHEVRDGDFVKFNDGHASRVRIDKYDAKWTYTNRNGSCVEPFRVPPEEGIERLYTIQEVGEILEQAFRAQTRAAIRASSDKLAAPLGAPTERADEASAEAGGGLTGVESDIYGECTAAQPVAIELRTELQVVREALLARDSEGTCEAVIRWRDDLRQLEADMHDIDEARGMLCGELVMDDTGNTVEIMRQAALAIARHRVSTEALSKIRAELAAVEAKFSAQGAGLDSCRAKVQGVP